MTVLLLCVCVCECACVLLGAWRLCAWRMNVFVMTGVILALPTGWVRKPRLFSRVDRATRTRACVVCACAEVAAKHPESARAARRRGSHDERPQQTQPGRPGGRGQRSRDRQVPAPAGNSTKCAASGQCLHGGTCLDGRCRCAPGYQGAACQRRQ